MFIKNIGDIYEYLILVLNPSIYGYIDMSADVFILSLSKKIGIDQWP